MQESCIDEFDAMNCNGAIMFCETEIAYPFMMSGENALILVCFGIDVHVCQARIRMMFRKIVHQVNLATRSVMPTWRECHLFHLPTRANLSTHLATLSVT